MLLVRSTVFEAVAWCGSSAIGAADSYSDFDFYVYTHAPVPVAAREAVIARRATEYQLNNGFRRSGTDRPTSRGS